MHDSCQMWTLEFLIIRFTWMIHILTHQHIFPPVTLFVPFLPIASFEKPLKHSYVSDDLQEENAINPFSWACGILTRVVQVGRQRQNSTVLWGCGGKGMSTFSSKAPQNVHESI